MTEPAYLHTTRAGFDTIVVDYAERSRTELVERPLDRALLAAFAELVQSVAAGPGSDRSPGSGVGPSLPQGASADADPPDRPVADVGCGPGHITAHLRGLGLSAFGVDLSPEMVAWARRAYPAIRFDVGSMTALALPDAALAGILAFYSIMSIPTEHLPRVFGEFSRTLRPGGRLLAAVLVGDGHRQWTDALGHAVALDYYLRPPDQLAELLRQTGFLVDARMVREPDDDETFPRAYLLAHKPGGADSQTSRP